MMAALVDVSVEVVVHDDLGADGQPAGSASATLRTALAMSGVAPTLEAGLLLAAGRLDEEQERIGVLATDLVRALDLDLEDDVDARRRIGRRRAVQVAEEVGPLEEPALGDASSKSARVTNT